MGTRIVFATAIVLLVAGAAAQREGTSGSDGDTFIVVSVTPFSQFTFDVKLKNPRTGYVHSVTVTVDVARLIRAGDRVRKRTRGREVILTPVGPEERQPAPSPPPPPHLPWEQPADAAEPRVPCRELPCERPLQLRAPSSANREFRPGQVRATRSVRVASMGFRYDRANAGNPSLGDCDVLASGSFTDGGINPVVPLKIGGTPIVSGYADKQALFFHGTNARGVTTRFRGAIALSDRGIPRIVRQTGNLATDFARGRGFMGGGALLLHGGYKIDQEDLCCCQAFVDDFPRGRGETRTLNPGKCGFAAGQLAAGAQHIVVASRGSEVWVFATQQDGQGIQSMLFNAGFTDAVLLDGGTGAFMLDRKGFVFNGRAPRGRTGKNSMRLCIQEREPRGGLQPAPR